MLFPGCLVNKNGPLSRRFDLKSDPSQTKMTERHGNAGLCGWAHNFPHGDKPPTSLAHYAKDHFSSNLQAYIPELEMYY